MKNPLKQMTLYEYIQIPTSGDLLDRNQGIIRNVKVLGTTSRNKRRYPNEVLFESLSLYENAKVNLNHPEGDPLGPRNYQDRFGAIRNVRFIENDGIFADFYFNPKHPLAEQFLWDAEHAPENVGFSHNIEAEVLHEEDAVVVKKIIAVRSVDLVADPATTQGLFESMENRKNNSVPEEKSSRTVLLEHFCHKLSALLVKQHPQMEKIFSDTFFQSIQETSDLKLLQNLLGERVTLAESLLEEHFHPAQTTVTIAREQTLPEQPITANRFAKMIKQQASDRRL